MSIRTVRSLFVPFLFLMLPAAAVALGTAGALPAQVQFGTGCAAGATTPVIDLQGDPRVGNEVRYRMLLAPPNSLSLLLVGLSDRVHAGVPLPLDLRPWLGPASTCSLLVAAHTVTTTATDASGVAAFYFFIPNHPALVDQSLFAQWSVFHQSAPGGLAMTPGLATGVNRRCWWCGTYTSVHDPLDVRRICSPNWNTCPSIATLEDGFRGTLNTGTCACNG